MPRKFLVDEIRHFLEGQSDDDLCYYIVGPDKTIKDIREANTKARAYLAQKFSWVHDATSDVRKSFVTVVPMNRPKLPRVIAGGTPGVDKEGKIIAKDAKVYVEGTIRGRYRFHKGKAVEGVPTPPDLAKREANKRKSKSA